MSGSSKKKLDYYLLYFQRYFQYKKSCYPKKESFPLGISQLVLDTITALRPKLELYEDFEAACAGVLKVEEEFIAVAKPEDLRDEDRAAYEKVRLINVGVLSLPMGWGMLVLQ